MITFTRILLIGVLSLSLAACASMPKTSPRVMSELAYGKQLFKDGYYKRAMHDLLPLACDGNAEAQYAVGYMYYYGEGVSQDTDVGAFWIHRSASQGFKPAQDALDMIEKEGTHTLHEGEKR